MVQFAKASPRERNEKIGEWGGKATINVIGTKGAGALIKSSIRGVGTGLEVVGELTLKGAKKSLDLAVSTLENAVEDGLKAGRQGIKEVKKRLEQKPALKLKEVSHLQANLKTPKPSASSVSTPHSPVTQKPSTEYLSSPINLFLECEAITLTRHVTCFENWRDGSMSNQGRHLLYPHLYLERFLRKVFSPSHLTHQNFELRFF